MRYILTILTLLTLSFKTYAQSEENDFFNSSYDSLYNSIKNLDSLNVEQNEAINSAVMFLIHLSKYKGALQFLDLSYKHDSKDSITKNLIYETLLAKISTQKIPKTNITDILTYRQKYEFLRSSSTLGEILFRDSQKVLISIFEDADLKSINYYYDLTANELSSSKNKHKLIALPNTESMFFNVAMKNHLKKNKKKCQEILRSAIEYYPNSKDMKTLLDLSLKQ